MVETARSMTEDITSGSFDPERKRKTVEVGGGQYHISDIYKLLSSSLGTHEKLTIQKSRHTDSTRIIGMESGKILALIYGKTVDVMGAGELDLSGVLTVEEKERVSETERLIRGDIESGKWCDHGQSKCFCGDLPDMDTFFMGDCEYIDAFTGLGMGLCRWLLTELGNRGHRGREYDILQFTMEHNGWLVVPRTKPRRIARPTRTPNRRKRPQRAHAAGGMRSRGLADHVCGARL